MTSYAIMLFSTFFNIVWTVIFVIDMISMIIIFLLSQKMKLSVFEFFKEWFAVHFQVPQNLPDYKLWYWINMCLQCNGSIKICTRPFFVATSSFALLNQTKSLAPKKFSEFWYWNVWQFQCGHSLDLLDRQGDSYVLVKSIRRVFIENLRHIIIFLYDAGNARCNNFLRFLCFSLYFPP